MGRQQKAIPVALALLLSGCFGSGTNPTAPNEFQIGLREVKDEYLKSCDGLGDRPGSGVGDLLQDFNDASALGGLCRSRHEALVEYLRPLVEKAKTGPR